jgi:hypothetical protein
MYTLIIIAFHATLTVTQVPGFTEPALCEIAGKSGKQ